MASLTRLERLRNRRVDPLIKIGGLNEAYNRLASQDSSIQYAIGAMQPIDPEYTQRTIEERNRVEAQLAECYRTASREVTFDYQGSVTNDTHIRAHSDVDLLTVDGKWHSVQPPNKPSFPYAGDTIQDLRELRFLAAARLKSSYPAAVVDESGGKAINISGGSLKRKIDVIACAYWRTVEFIQSGQKHYLGIEVLDHSAGSRIANKPFLHNKLIEDKDRSSNGGLRKLIRLLKSLKYDSDEGIDLSSYDIAGIVYNIPDSWLFSMPSQDLGLMKNCHNYLVYLQANPVVRNALEVPNKTRKVFCSDGASEAGLRQMADALGGLLRDIELGLSRSFKKLEEARIMY